MACVTVVSVVEVPEAARGGAAAEPVVPVDPLRRVFEQHYSWLVGMARLLVDDRGSAEEVAQEAFAKAYARGDRLRDREDPYRYIRSAVINLSRSRLRRRRVADRHGERRSVVEAGRPGHDRSGGHHIDRAVPHHRPGPAAAAPRPAGQRDALRQQPELRPARRRHHDRDRRFLAQTEPIYFE